MLSDRAREKGRRVGHSGLVLLTPGIPLHFWISSQVSTWCLARSSLSPLLKPHPSFRNEENSCLLCDAETIGPFSQSTSFEMTVSSSDPGSVNKRSQ